MKLYLLLGILFLLVLWDISQNRGQFVRATGAFFAGVLKTVGLI
jgi:hypothetical protein